MELFIKLCKFSWGLRHQFAKYFIVGVSGFALNMTLLIFAKEYLGISAVVATSVIGLFMLVFNFCLNKYWSFKEKSMPHKQFMRYLILAGGDYFFAILTMYIFHRLIGWDYRLVNIGTVSAMVSWNFLIYKYWVYR